MMRAIILGLTVLVLAANGFSQAKLVIPSNKYKFGLMPQSSTVVHYFWFKSTGADTVRISKIVTGCTCALMPLQRDWLAPADSMRVGIFWETGRSIGATGRYPRVYSNAEKSPVHISLVGQVVAVPDSLHPVSVKPYKFELARTERVSIDSISFMLTNRSDEDIELKVVSYPVDQCEYVLPEALPAGSTWTGYIKVKPEFTDSEFKSSITLELSDYQETRFTIPIRRKFY